MNHHLAPPVRTERTLPLRIRFTLALLPVLLAGACTGKSSDRPPPGISLGQFTEVHLQAGMDFKHGFTKSRGRIQRVTGGVACGDFDNDGFPDLYVVAGDTFGNLLYRNKGDGTFEEIAKKVGVSLDGGAWCSASFVDLNGDGYLDLFLGGVVNTSPRILINQGDGPFKDATSRSGLDIVVTDSLSAAFGDYDRDGDLDLFLTQWSVKRTNRENTQHLWQNNGDAVFTDVSRTTGISAAFDPENKGFTDLSFTPNFVDVNNDGFLDLLITGDVGTNKVLLNVARGNQRGFESATTSVLSSEHSTGAAVGDYDNDGDLDWFVSGVYHAPGSSAGPLTGNRLFRNSGDGTFADTTDLAGVRQSGWGWAASFADFNNDGHLDIVQVNGFGTAPTDVFHEFLHDPTSLFMSRGDGSFVEQAAAVGLFDDQQGRGVVCFDYDRDGDLDIFSPGFFGEPRLWQNNLVRGNYLAVGLTYRAGNPRGIGARIKITIDGESQVRELRAGSHYVSQNDVEAHFGTGGATVIDTIEVTWPDGTTTVQKAVNANQLIRVER